MASLTLDAAEDGRISVEKLLTKVRWSLTLPIMSKKRKTRKQKKRAQERRRQKIEQRENAQAAVDELLASDPAEADADEAESALGHLAILRDGQVWRDVTAWVAWVPCELDGATRIVWRAVEEASERQQFGLGCAAICGFLQGERKEWAIELAGMIADASLQAAGRASADCVEALQALAERTDASCVTKVLKAAYAVAPPDNAEQEDAAAKTDSDDATEFELVELLWARRGGAIEARGRNYQNDVGALWVLRSLDEASGISSVGFERLEDVELELEEGARHSDLPSEETRVYIQAKTRGDRQGNWTVARLCEGNNAVLPHFLELHVVDREAALMFVSNRQLGGTGAALKRVSQKVRQSRCSVAELRELGEGHSLRLSGEEERAIGDLEEKLEISDWGDADLTSFVERLYFRQLPHPLQNSGVVELGRHLDQPVALVEVAWSRLCHAVSQESEKRGTISRSDAERLIEQIVNWTQATAHVAPDPEVILRPLDLEEQYEEEEAYWLGVRATLRHILADQDVVRPKVLAEISTVFKSHRLCIIRSPSGQGKSTCMYRWAVEQRDDFRAWEMVRVGSEQEAEAIAAVLEGAAPTADSPVLLLADDIFDMKKREVGHLLDLLGEIPHVYVLGTSREDDWQEMRPRGIAPGVIRLSLDKDSARTISELLTDKVGELEMPWSDAYELSVARTGRALLMEYVHYLQRGVSLESTLAEQVAALDEKHPDLANSLHATLRHVALMDVCGSAVSSESLELLLGDDEGDLRRCVAILKDEHLIKQDDDRRFVGLHRLRSEMLSQICSETVPLGVTAVSLVNGLPVLELAVVLERLLTHSDLDVDALLSALWQRISGGDIAVGELPKVFEAVFAADQRQYAEKCHDCLRELEQEPRIPVVRLLPSERLPDGSSMGVFDVELMPADALEARDALPERPLENTLLSRLLGENVASLADELRRGPVRAIGEVLDWVAYTSQPEAVELVRHLGVERIEQDLQAASARDFGTLIAAIRRVDQEKAEYLYEQLGGAALVRQKILGEDYHVMSVEQVNSTRWYLQWSCGRELASDIPNELIESEEPDKTSWELGQLLLRCVPSAEQVEVQPTDETQTTLGFREHEFGKKMVKRSKTYRQEDVARNARWMSVFIGPYRADTWSGFFRHLNEARELAVRIATELTELIVGNAPVPISEKEVSLLPNELIGQGETLHNLAHSLPMVPVDIPSPKPEGKTSSNGSRKVLTTYFDRLLNVLEFLEKAETEQDEHQLLLARVNAGMAIYQQNEMLQELSCEQVPPEPSFHLARLERQALSGLHAAVRKYREEGFRRVVQRGATAARIVEGLRSLLLGLAALPNTRENDMVVQDLRVLGHAVGLCEELEEGIGGGPRVTQLSKMLRIVQDYPDERKPVLHSAILLSDQLADESGSALAADTLDAERLQNCTERVAEAVEPYSSQEAQVGYVGGYIAPLPDDSGFVRKEVVLGVVSPPGLDADAEYAELMAVAANNVEERPARIQVLFLQGDTVLPEPGRLLHLGNEGPVGEDYVMEHWLPLIPEPQDVARHGLQIGSKPPILETFESGLRHLISGLSWASWLDAESQRSAAELRARIVTMSKLCKREIQEAVARLEGARVHVKEGQSAVDSVLVDDVSVWLDRSRDRVERQLQRVEEGEAEHALLGVLGRTMKAQPVEMSELSITDAELVIDYFELRGRLLEEVYGEEVR